MKVKISTAPEKGAEAPMKDAKVAAKKDAKKAPPKDEKAFFFSSKRMCANTHRTKRVAF